ncbi:MAG TPA: hypothetical protein PLT66_06170 [Bacillota bacterium]|nr:hypothetical protein [Bacillota bacterium]
MDEKVGKELETIQAIADKQKDELKITLLEQHLMKARDEYNALKKEQGESVGFRQGAARVVRPYRRGVEHHQE